MSIPFQPNELFELNPDRSPVELHENWLSVDNFYKNYDLLFDVLNSMPKESWKADEGTRNFKDYYDCRPAFFDHMGPRNGRLQQMNHLLNHWIDTYLRPNKPSSNLPLVNRCEFNVFKFIKEYDHPYQHCIHQDMGWTVLIYLDKVADGGTALYESPFNQTVESVNLMQDVSEEKVIEVIPAKPNRLVIFDGKKWPHSAYFDNHKKYISDWRMNQVMFLPEDKHEINDRHLVQTIGAPGGAGLVDAISPREVESDM